MAHNFPPDFPSVEVASGVMSMLLTHPRFYSVVAESEGRIVGSNFLDERSSIAGVGPITVDPAGQNHGVGGRLMQDVLVHEGYDVVVVSPTSITFTIEPSQMATGDWKVHVRTAGADIPDSNQITFNVSA